MAWVKTNASRQSLARLGHVPCHVARACSLGETARAALRETFATLTEIVHAYRDGTRYGIGMDPDDGLVRAGIPGQQLTWMDARVNGREITPRSVGLTL